jgi:phage-related protein
MYESWKCGFIGPLAETNPYDHSTVGRAIRSIQTFGLDAPNVSLRQVKGKLWEIRASAQRVFYVLASGGTLWLLHAYKKEGQKAPRGEIEIATSRMKEVLADR